jgi:hypothetical protein
MEGPTRAQQAAWAHTELAAALRTALGEVRSHSHQRFPRSAPSL